MARWSFWRLVLGAHRLSQTGQVGDGRERTVVDYVVSHAREGDIDDVLGTLDWYAYHKSLLINIGDVKGRLLDAAVNRSDPKVVLELGTYCGYSALRIAREAPSAHVYSVELSAENAELARRVWELCRGRRPDHLRGGHIGRRRAHDRPTRCGHRQVTRRHSGLRVHRP